MIILHVILIFSIYLLIHALKLVSFKVPWQNPEIIIFITTAQFYLRKSVLGLRKSNCVKRKQKKNKKKSQFQKMTPFSFAVKAYKSIDLTCM